VKKKLALNVLVFAAISLQAQTLSWDIKFLRGRERESIPISQIIRMQTGEEFSINIIPASDCFLYVVCYDSSRQLIVFYYGQALGGSQIHLGPYRLVDPPGTETLYVIISLSKEEQLETLIQNHINNTDSRQHADSLRREVARLQNVSSELGEPASIFIPSGGTTRGFSQEYVTRFTGNNMYVRTIAIRH